jgi:hypothetical protein
MVWEETPKCSCGTLVMESLEGNLDTVLQGYLICKGCGRLIEVATDTTRRMDTAVDEIDQMVSQILGHPVHIQV